MVLAPKTKLLIGLGAFILVVFGLLSLSGNTFSGSVTDLIIPQQGNPKLCADLQKACTEAGGKGIPCDNYGKLCTSILQLPTSEATTETTTTTPPTAPRRRAPNSVTPQTNSTSNTRSAAPEVPAPKPDTTPPTSAADLQSLQELFPESPSQGQINDSQLR